MLLLSNRGDRSAPFLGFPILCVPLQKAGTTREGREVCGRCGFISHERGWLSAAGAADIGRIFSHSAIVSLEQQVDQLAVQ